MPYSSIRKFGHAVTDMGESVYNRGVVLEGVMYVIMTWGEKLRNCGWHRIKAAEMIYSI
uniref:hypothetical protein n=1 Tax=Agathobacter sp. TaxID=2021311 RepID=UPI0040561DDD